MLGTAELQAQVAELRARLGEELLILGHHYQKDEVLQFADFRGDSLQLARESARRAQAHYIVFCGVQFMAEMAAILAQPHQTVILPDLQAGCPLAESADLQDVERVWAELMDLLGAEEEVMPVVYVNSSAQLKAFCGARGGLVCTSANAREVLSWALNERPRVLFLPDQYLGRNTAKRLGLRPEEVLLWDPYRPLGGHRPEAVRRARLLLWPGECYVHTRFRPTHVLRWRKIKPGVRVIVHPECVSEVVDLADEVGSTSYIIRRVEEAPPGTAWAIGTEFNLVHRLARLHPEQWIRSLSDEPHYCGTMNLITLEKLARVLQGLARGEVINAVTVPPEVREPARLALERMLRLGGA